MARNRTAWQSRDDSREDGEECKQPDSVEVQLPGGWRAKASGQQTMLAVLIVVCTLGLFSAGYAHDQKVGANLSQIIEAQVKYAEAVAEMTYLMSLSQERREALNLVMPPSLRRKINGG